MKYINKYILIAISIIFLTGCDGFLKESSGDLLIPQRLDEYIPLLYGEGYPKRFDREAAWIKLMTDDVEMAYLENERDDVEIQYDTSTGGDGRYAYVWEYNIEQYLRDDFWGGRYSNILGCNTIIEALPEMTYGVGEEAKFNYLAAQAYTLRAFHYFALVNTYALPYSEENRSELGVVIRTEPEIEEKPRARSTIGEVWDLINDDIEKAVDYMEKAVPSVNLHLINPAALYLLASRVALFQEKWDDVIDYGTKFMAENSYIYNLNNGPRDSYGADREPFTIFNTDINDEIVFTFGSYYRQYEFMTKAPSFWALGFRTSLYTDDALIKIYDENDYRLKAYFEQDYIIPGTWGDPDTYVNTLYYPAKYSDRASNYRENWRTVEVYLNMMEAYARRSGSVSDDAIDLLNLLRSNRIDTEHFEELSASDFSNKDELVKFIWEERRRELCFEEIMRFWDLRRMGMPRIEHRWYSDKTNYETYVLEQGSSNYTLQIPISESRYNDAIVPNPRDVIKNQ